MSSKIELGIAVFELTDACNQTCLFCYNHWKSREYACSIAKPDFRLARRTLKRLLSEAQVGSISFSGGEPMLMPRIHDLVLRARFAGSNVNILTNGTLLTQDDIAIFADLGVGRVQIPILSADSSTHDHITQLQGSWQRAVESARRVIESGNNRLLPVFILSRQNIDHIESTFKFYAELGLTEVMANRFNIGGLGISNAELLNLSLVQLRDGFARIERQAKEYGMVVYSGVCTPQCILNPKDYRHIRFSHCNTDIKSRPLTINYRGDVRFCNHSPRVLGNIHKESLWQILSRSEESAYFSTVPQYCSKCELWSSCRGGCRAASEQLYGNFERVDPILATKEVGNSKYRE